MWSVIAVPGTDTLPWLVGQVPRRDKKFSSVQLQVKAVAFHGNHWIDSLPLATELSSLVPCSTFEVSLNNKEKVHIGLWLAEMSEKQEEPGPAAQGRRSSLSGVCYLTMGLLVLLLGLVFASMYVYRYFFITQLPRESVFHCGVLYEDSLYSPFKGQLELHEDVKIYIEENYEQINVPVPQFGGSDPADIIHDFQRGLTAYHDITLDKCYVIELNTTIVMPPRNLWELLVNVKKGTYLPQTYIIQEEMIATEHVSDMEQLGSFIYRLCSGKETYRLRRRGARRRISRREAGNCHRIRHFENTFVVETVICQKS